MSYVDVRKILHREWPHLILAFRFLLPIDPARRLRSILVAIVHDLNTMAAADSLRLGEKCRARTHHRVLRMLANARNLDDNLSAIVEGVLATLAIGRDLQRLRKTALNGDVSPGTSESLRDITLQLAAAIRKPDEILSQLTAVSGRLRATLEAPPLDHDAPLPQPLSVENHAQPFSSGILLVARRGSQCHI